LSIVAEWVCVGHKSSTSAPLGVLRRTLSTPGTSSATHGPSLGAASSKSIKDHPEEETHFGFKTVKKEEKASLVGEVFHRVASNYDLMNDVMSAGIHRFLAASHTHTRAHIHTRARARAHTHTTYPLFLLFLSP